MKDKLNPTYLTHCFTWILHCSSSDVLCMVAVSLHCQSFILPCQILWSWCSSCWWVVCYVWYFMGASVPWLACTNDNIVSWPVLAAGICRVKRGIVCMRNYTAVTSGAWKMIQYYRVLKHWRTETYPAVHATCRPFGCFWLEVKGCTDSVVLYCFR